MAPLRVAVLGTGMSAFTFHIPFITHLSDDFILHSIFERSATAEKSKTRDNLPGSSVKVVTSLDHVLQDNEVDVVWVTTINDTHFEYGKAALKAGKHVVMEKPFTPTAAEAYELAELANKQNLVLAVYQNRRWDSDYLTVKKLLAENAFGELSEFTSHFDRYKNEAATAKLWKEKALPGSGCSYDLGSHLIDQILDLFGPPDRVTGLLRNSRLIGASEVDDSFIVHLHYGVDEKKGRKLPLIATARASILSLVTPQTRFVIKGTEGAFVKYGVDVQEDQLKAGQAEAINSPDFGAESESLYGTFYASSGSRTVKSEVGSYLKWFSNVSDAIKSGDSSKLIVKPEQAALTIRIIELARESSKTGRTISL